LRARFLDLLGPTLGTVGFDLPLRRAGKHWELAEPLPWDRWDASTYQLAPAKANVSASASKRRRKE